jgi:hypothetical protein
MSLPERFVATPDDVLTAATANWHEQLADVSLPTVCVPLSAAAVAFIHSGAFVLPADSCEPSLYPDYLRAAAVVFGTFAAEHDLVFPKLTWSAPVDAAWMRGDAKGASLACSSFNEALMLLKASDFVVHDITSPFEGTSPSSSDGKVEPAPLIQHHLILKRWYDLHDSREFRVFVAGGRYVAATQRDASTHFPSLETEQPELDACLRAFVARVAPRLPTPTCVLDVYITPTARRSVRLVDINPWLPTIVSPGTLEWTDIEAAAVAVVDGPAPVAHADVDFSLPLSLAQPHTLARRACTASAVPLEMSAALMDGRGDIVAALQRLMSGEDDSSDTDV